LKLHSFFTFRTVKFINGRQLDQNPNNRESPSPVTRAVFNWRFPGISTRLFCKESTHKAAIRWIFNCKLSFKIHDYLSGLGPYQFRIECLRAGLARSFNNLSSHNPLVAARSTYFLSNSRHFILHECFKSNYWTSFKTANQLKKVTWKTHMNREFIRCHQSSSQSSAMIGYYLPTIDNSRASPMFHLSSSQFYLTLKWRTNRCLPYRYCTCSALINRSHIVCVLASTPAYNAILSSSRFKTKLTYMLSLPNARHFNPLDHLLNIGDHLTFLDLFYRLKTALDAS